MNEIIPAVEGWLSENNPAGVTRRPDGTWEFTAAAEETRAAAVTAGRPVYEAFCRAFPSESWGPWELLDAESRAGWADIARAAVTPGAPS